MNPYSLLSLPEINQFQQEKALDGLLILEKRSTGLVMVWRSPTYMRFVKRYFPNQSDSSFDLPLVFESFIKNNRQSDSKIDVLHGKLRCHLFKKEYHNYIFLAITELAKEVTKNYEKDRFSYIIEGTGIGLWEWNIQTKEVRLSPEWANILGYELEDLYPIGEHIWKDLCHPDDYEYSQRLFQAHFSEESEFYRGEARMKHASGKWIWVFDQGKVVTWKDNRPEWMVGYHREITNVKFQLEIQKTFIEESPVAIAMMDKKFNYLAASNKFLEDYDISEDIHGKNHYELFDIPKRLKEVHQQCLKGAVLSSDEDSFLGRNGEIQYLQWLVKPWYEGDIIGGIIMQTANLNNIKKLELERLYNQRLLASIFENIEVGLITVNLKGKVVLTNHFAKSLFSIPGVEITEDNWDQFFEIYSVRNMSKILKRGQTPLRRLSKGERFSNYEVLLVGGRQSRYLRINGTPILDEHGDRMGGVLSIYDFTENWEAEKNLRLSEETFKASFEKAPIGMGLVSTDGKWLQINARISNILGYTEEELLRLTFRDVTHPEDLAMDEQFVQLLIDKKQDDYQIEKRYIHKDGSIIYAILAVSIVREYSGIPLFFVSQITDITELKKSKQDLEHVLAITRKQNDRLKNFAHIVSHNLRSHSGNIQMLTEMLLEDYEMLKDNQIMDMIQQASSQLSDTIAHLNEVVVLNTTDEIALRPLILYDYILKTLRNVSGLVEKNTAKIHLEVDKNLRVYGVPAYLDSILLNFTTNAFKYSDPNKNLVLVFRASLDERYLLLEIEDNGIGIDLNRHRDKIFGMYKTFHSHKDSRGIGLFITKNQIEAIGGEVEVESTVGKGTKFKIYLQYEKN